MLLGFAAGCAFGLFFGWLLHRERVERALYEDVVRTRDRATATLAETSARLELANKDTVRLRKQLTDVQHLLVERDSTIGELEDELAELEADDDLDDEPSADEPIDVAADAATTPDDVRLFDDAELDETDITEEVALPAEDAAEAGTAGADDDDEPDAAAADGDPASEVVAAPASGVGTGAAPEAEDVAVVGEAPATGIPLDMTDDVPVDHADDVPAEPLGTAPDGARDADADEADAEVPLAPEAQAAPKEEPADDAEIGTPLVLEADAPDPQSVVADDALQRISGVGPALERQLRAEGITTYRQLALLDDPAIAELEARRPRLATRLRRGGWVAQARRLHVETHGSQP